MEKEGKKGLQHQKLYLYTKKRFSNTAVGTYQEFLLVCVLSEDPMISHFLTAINIQ